MKLLVHRATFSATADEWGRFADWFDDNHKTRLAAMIRVGVRRQQGRYAWLRHDPGSAYSVTVRDGSIRAIVDAAVEIGRGGG